MRGERLQEMAAAETPLFRVDAPRHCLVPRCRRTTPEWVTQRIDDGWTPQGIALTASRIALLLTPIRRKLLTRRNGPTYCLVDAGRRRLLRAGESSPS
jgi:hypothetical protein